MEELMYYVWSQRLAGALRTVDGSDIEILHPGLRNLDAGPDFFNAKVRIGGTTWAGNVEMHVRASDWHRHRHHDNPAYDSVILHVVLTADADIRLSDGEPLRTVVMQIPPAVMQRYEELTVGATAIPCAAHLADVPAIILHDWQTALAVERMLGKAARVRDLIEADLASWPAAFYVILARSLGTGINSDACERLARSLPYAYIQKHIDNRLQVEALLLGQAGWLTQPQPGGGTYYDDLRREYLFLAAKFGLTPLPAAAWRFARMRPQASPQLRVASLAALLCERRNLFDDLMSAPDLATMERLLTVRLPGWWQTHYSLHPDPSPEVGKGLGRATVRSLVINAVVPIMLAYAQWQGDEERSHRAIQMLGELPPESNRYMGEWLAVGVPLRSAFDTQAMLHLYREYCEPRKCMRCRIGCWLIRHRGDQSSS